MDSKEINNLADQYINFIKSNKQLMDMIKTETIDKESFKNYHVIDHDYIIQWKNLISYDKLTKKNKEEICDIIRKNNINSKKFNLENKKFIIKMELIQWNHLILFQMMFGNYSIKKMKIQNLMGKSLY
jgi:hypothetical protein